MRSQISPVETAAAPIGDRESHSRTANCDVVVLGSGAGGLAAAIAARYNGLDVIVLEKAPVLGGTTAISGGGSWIPCNPLAAAEGLSDSKEQARRYFQNCTGNRFDSARVEAFLENGPAMVDFFQRNTALQFSVTADRPDYHPDVDGASLGGRTIFPLPYDGRVLGREIKRLRLPKAEMTFMGIMIKPGAELWHFLNVFRSFKSTKIVARRIVRQLRDVALYGRGMDLANGNALAGRLVKSALDLGIPLHTSAEGVRLLRGEKGRVDGVEYRQDGALKQLFARRGVVLAAGGFPHDAMRRARLYNHVANGGSHFSSAPAENTGDGINMAEAIGAHVETNLSNAAAWIPVSLVPNRSGKVVTYPHTIDRQKPGFIAVSPNGRRFCNEANSYHDFCQALIAACANEPETFCYLIADHRAARRYGIGYAKPNPLPLSPHIRSGYLASGSTIAELAQHIRIDARVLVETVDNFNRLAVEGEDPEFGRGSTAYNRYLGDPAHAPNPCVAPLHQAPFYAVKVFPGDAGTFAGLATDEYARVLDGAGNPIAGLYAAGNDLSSVMSGDYVGGGTTLGPALTFGYIAGRHLAGVAPPNAMA